MAIELPIVLANGLFADLPNTGIETGETFYTTDRKTFHIADGATSTYPAVPAVDLLTTLASVDGAADFLLIHDANAVGVKEKKITINAFRTALNIPTGSTDELVAVVDGGTSGYVWGTDGTDGILRAGSSMGYTKDAGNAFVTLNVADGGISTAKLADDAVTNAKIADDAVGTAQIADDAVTQANIAAGAVGATEIAAGAVGNTRLASTALDIDSTYLGGNGITTSLTITRIAGGTF